MKVVVTSPIYVQVLQFVDPTLITAGIQAEYCNGTIEDIRNLSPNLLITDRGTEFALRAKAELGIEIVLIDSGSWFRPAVNDMPPIGYQEGNAAERLVDYALNGTSRKVSIREIDPTNASALKPYVRSRRDAEYLSSLLTKAQRERNAWEDICSLQSRIRKIVQLIVGGNLPPDKLGQIEAILGLEAPAQRGIPIVPIEALDFSVRTHRCLERAGILTLAAIAAWSEEELMNIRNFGRKSLVEVIDKLDEYGLALPACPQNESETPGYPGVVSLEQADLRALSGTAEDEN